MTAQASELLIYQGQELSLCETPLDDYLASSGRHIEFEATSTALWRGYVGTWEIINARLYLVALDGCMLVDNEPTAVKLKDVFPQYPEGLFAHWYSGELRCPRGKLLNYVHGGFMSTYEEDLFIEVRNGVVTAERVVVNGKGEPDANEGYAEKFICHPGDLIEPIEPEQAERPFYVKDPLGRVPNNPFGHMQQGWVQLLSQLEPSDTLWRFKSPQRGWQDACSGYAVVRQRQVIAEFIYERHPQ